MTPIFAISRIAGWCAHIIEEALGEAQEKPTLYRPKAEYVGNYCGLTGCSYEPCRRADEGGMIFAFRFSCCPASGAPSNMT